MDCRMLLLYIVILTTSLLSVVLALCTTPVTLDATNVGNQWNIEVTDRSPSESREALDQYSESESDFLGIGVTSDKATITFDEDVQVTGLSFATKFLKSNTISVYNGNDVLLDIASKTTGGRKWVESSYTLTNIAAARKMVISWQFGDFSDFGIKGIKITVCKDFCRTVKRMKTNAALNLPRGFSIDVVGGPSVDSPAKILEGSKQTVQLKRTDTEENVVRMTFDSAEKLHSMKIRTAWTSHITMTVYDGVQDSANLIYTQTAFPSPVSNKIVKTVMTPLITEITDVRRVYISFGFSSDNLIKVRGLRLTLCA